MFCSGCDATAELSCTFGYKGCGIRRLLERRMNLWRDEQFDVVISSGS